MSQDDDLDPAAPLESTEAPQDDAAAAANYGTDGRGDVPQDEAEMEAPPTTGPAVVQFAIAKASDFLKQCMTSHPRVHYKLGAKVNPGARPGVDFTAVDCSGFVREAVRRSTNLGNHFPDGSVVQHDWVKQRGFAKTTIDAAKDQSDMVRIAFLSPGDTASGIGHVVLVYKGETLESHGGVGPDARAWNGQSWQAKASVYVLDPSGTDGTS